MRSYFLILLFCFSFVISKSQELFPHVDPASLVPKGVLGVRIYNEGFKEVDQYRSLQNVRFMLGLNSKLMLTQSFSFSNHHSKNFPSDFIRNDGTIGFHTHGVKKGLKYPYLFESLGVNVKYRFLSIDGEKEHFRMAAYFELSGCNAAHDEAEPSLMGDNGGVGAGITATKLKKRFAISASFGGILPHNYYYQQGDSSLEVSYGNGLNYSLSMGLLCLPIKYKSYDQTNVNLYAEFIGKAYQGATILSNDKQIQISNVPSLEKGNYIEFRPSIQFIFHSNLRLDFSVARPLVGRSYVRTYPAYYFTIQRYFYFK
jgi:hypothetical protein